LLQYNVLRGRVELGGDGCRRRGEIGGRRRDKQTIEAFRPPSASGLIRL